MPRNRSRFGGGEYTRDRGSKGPLDGQCHRKQTAAPAQAGTVRVKRRGKSPPLQAQARRHGKPHRVQGQIGNLGAARPKFRFGGTGFGYWLLRQMILSASQGAQTEFGL